MHKEAALVTERAMQVAPEDLGVLVNHAMVTAAKGDKPGALATLDGVLADLEGVGTDIEMSGSVLVFGRAVSEMLGK